MVVSKKTKAKKSVSVGNKKVELPRAKPAVKSVKIADLQGIESSPEYLEAVQAEVRGFNRLITKVLSQLPEQVEFMELTRRDKIMSLRTTMRHKLANFLEHENLAIIAKSAR